MEEYLVPTKDAVTEFTERRSRFIGHIWLTDTEEEALACIKKMREQHWDATHNVYAYIIKDGPTRYSDDGEPQGTAGMPVLEVLRREGLHNVCCVVTRYFGGILLGAGGLVRAYARSAKDAVDAAGISIKRVWKQAELRLPYNLFERMKQELERNEGLLLNVEYSADICMRVLLPAACYEAYCARVIDVSNGKVTPILLGEEYRAVPRP